MKNLKLKFKKSKSQKLFLFSFFIVVLHFSFLFFHLRQANAQSLALSISPPLLEVMIKPGKSITQVYKLTNNGEPTVVTLRIMELGPNGIKDEAGFMPSDSEGGPEEWITIISNDIRLSKPFLLEKEKSAEFLIRVAPREGTKQQDYYRALVVTTDIRPQTDTTMTSFVESIASPILVTVTSSGVLNKAAQIAKFDVPAVLDSFDALSAHAEVKNTGTTYFRTQGKMTLTGMVGKGSFDLIPYAVLSGETKKIIVTTDNPQGKSLLLPGFYLGKYQLLLEFSLDGGKEKVSAVKTFYAVPWKAGVILILFILGIKLLKSLKLFKKDNQ